MENKISACSLYGWVSVYALPNKRIKQQKKDRVQPAEKSDSNLHNGKDQKRRGLKLSIFV